MILPEMNDFLNYLQQYSYPVHRKVVNCDQQSLFICRPTINVYPVTGYGTILPEMNDFLNYLQQYCIR